MEKKRSRSGSLVPAGFLLSFRCKDGLVILTYKGCHDLLDEQENRRALDVLDCMGQV